MRPIATDGVAWSVCVLDCMFVCLLVTFVSPAKMAEAIEMPLVWFTQVGPRNHVLDGSPDLLSGRDNFGGCPAY